MDIASSYNGELTSKARRLVFSAALSFLAELVSSLFTRMEWIRLWQ
jgi:hypothetical protein